MEFVRCVKLHTDALYFSHDALLTAMFIHCDLPTWRLCAIPVGCMLYRAVLVWYSVVLHILHIYWFSVFNNLK
jgi:hypothetical protein